MVTITLLVHNPSEEANRLLTHLQRELAEEAKVVSPEMPPPDRDTPVDIDFVARVGKSGELSQQGAEHRICGVLDRQSATWRDHMTLQPQPKT